MGYKVAKKKNKRKKEKTGPHLFHSSFSLGTPLHPSNVSAPPTQDTRPHPPLKRVLESSLPFALQSRFFWAISTETNELVVCARIRSTALDSPKLPDIWLGYPLIKVGRDGDYLAPLLRKLSSHKRWRLLSMSLRP